MQGEEDNDGVLGMVKDGLVYHHVNAGDPRLLIERCQKQFSKNESSPP